jgi:hypothetical protein
MPNLYVYIHTHAYAAVGTPAWYVGMYVCMHVDLMLLPCPQCYPFTHTHAHTHTYIYTYTHTYIYIYTQIYTHTNAYISTVGPPAWRVNRLSMVHTHIHMHSYTYHTHTYAFIYISHTYICIHMHSYTYHTHTYAFIYISHTYIRIHIHITHIHMHSYICIVSIVYQWFSPPRPQRYSFSHTHTHTNSHTHTYISTVGSPAWRVNLLSVVLSATSSTFLFLAIWRWDLWIAYSIRQDKKPESEEKDIECALPPASAFPWCWSESVWAALLGAGLVAFWYVCVLVCFYLFWWRGMCYMYIHVYMYICILVLWSGCRVSPS